MERLRTVLKDRVYVVFGHGRQPQRQRCCSRCTVCVSVLPVRNRGRIHVSTLYPTTMLVHMISFISVIAVMIYFVLIRIKSRSNLLIYSTGATSPTATPVSWTAWSMPPRSPSSTAMSARCRFVARRRTWCITSRMRATVTAGPWRRTSSMRRATRSPCQSRWRITAAC